MVLPPWKSVVNFSMMTVFLEGSLLLKLPICVFLPVPQEIADTEQALSLSHHVFLAEQK